MLHQCKLHNYCCYTATRVKTERNLKLESNKLNGKQSLHGRISIQKATHTQDTRARAFTSPAAGAQ